MWLKAERVSLRSLTNADIPPVKHKHIGNVDFAYREYGTGPTVFAIPSWPYSSLVYVPLMRAIGQHVHLISPDLPGWCGHSSCRHFKPSVDTYSQMLAAFIKSFNQPIYSMMGYSFGGVFCQDLVDKELVRPEKVALISTLHDGCVVESTFHKKIQAYRLARKLHIPHFVIKRIAYAVITHNANDMINTIRDTPIYKRLEAETRGLNFNCAMDTAISLINTDVLPDHNFPTQEIVIYADSDLPYVRAESAKMAESLGIEPVILPDTNHDHMFMDVNKSSDLILNFLIA